MESKKDGAAIDEHQTRASLLTTSPPGSNLGCSSSNSSSTTNTNNARLRNEWYQLDEYDRALYLDAVETAIERGLHQRFAIFHFDELSEIQAHDTCGFYLWHRAFILAYETMLRSLEPRFACLGIPFWDIYLDYAKQESSSNSCRSYATCSKLINDLGGLVENDDFHERTYFGRTVDGLWHFRPPVQNLRDDRNRVGLIRYDLWYDPIPEEAALLSEENLPQLFGIKDRLTFWETLHHGIHDSVHDTIGGFMRTPASPIDPLFMPWHSTMELFDYVWEACHSNGADFDSDHDYGGEECLYSRFAREKFPNISLSTDAVYMKLNQTTDIRDDRLIGVYFSHSRNFSDLRTIRDLDEHLRFRYASVPEPFVRALANNTEACPNGLASILSRNEESSGVAAGRQPPTFSDQELETFKEDWMAEAEAYYATGDSNSTAANEAQSSTTNQQMSFLRCLLFEAMDRDTIERWAIDEDAFLTQVVTHQRYHNHPFCRDRLFGASALPNVDEIFSTESNKTTDGIVISPTNATATRSSGDYHGRQNSPSWILTVLLVWLVSTFTR